jgi:DNA-binding transcriptional MerR regulator
MEVDLGTLALTYLTHSGGAAWPKATTPGMNHEAASERIHRLRLQPLIPSPKTRHSLKSSSIASSANGQRGRETAKQTTESAIAEQLGVSIEEAKKIIDASREADEAKKSEIDKLKKQNESIKKDSEAKISEVQREHHIDRVKLNLIRAGVALPEDTAETPVHLTKLLIGLWGSFLCRSVQASLRSKTILRNSRSSSPLCSLRRRRRKIRNRATLVHVRPAHLVSRS